MLDRDRGRTARRPTRRPQAEALETRQLLVASLSPIGPLSVPQGLGFQLPLEGGAGRPQTYAVASDNPALRATVARGQFLTLGVTHASSGRAGDPTFNGTLTLQLFEDLTPLTAARIEQLVTQGFYTSPTTNPNPSELPGGVNLPSKNFHRVVPGFVVQAGSPTGTGTGNVNQPGFPFPDEFVQQLAFTGTGQLAMANAGDDTNSSQFFITTSSPRNLDFNHTIFGQLVADPQGILPQMEAVARDVPPNSTEQSRPVSPILITSATLSPVSPDGVVHIDTTTATAGQAATITVTATDPADGTTAVQSFPVTVAADPTNDRPFLGPIGDQVVGFARSVTFRVPVVNREPGDQLNFIVRGGINSATGQFTDVQNATVSINQTTGDVTVTPRANFPGGPITLLVGVRDQVDRSGQNNLEAVSNYDTQSITLTVTANTRPIAQSFPASTLSNAPVTIQLVGTDTDV
ncbi:MAG TPA: peptidylprolyl isomerase, partial [Isosphaeraceae bacterium]